MHDEISVDISPEYPVSWRVVAFNTVLRGTVKPISTILLRNTAGMAVASRLICLGKRLPTILPKQVSITEEPFGACSGEWVRSDVDLDLHKVVLYLHGGAYFICSPATHRPITWRLSAAAQRPVLALDYRQGPVHTLADSLSDALGAYRGLLDRGHAPNDILLAGDSAGGHLTLSTLLCLRDKGLPLPAAAVCLSPWTDLSGVRRRVNCWTDPMLPAGRVDWLAHRWTDGLNCRDPLVSPVYGDYTGIPPLMIVTGSTEILRDDGRRVALRARQDGVPVTYEDWKRMPHVFPIFADAVPEARMVFQHIARFIAAVEARSPSQARKRPEVVA